MKTRALFALLFGAALLRAADYPASVESDWVVRAFRLHTGETLPELRLHYFTVGAPTGEPVLILHGTNGTGNGFLMGLAKLWKQYLAEFMQPPVRATK